MRCFISRTGKVRLTVVAKNGKEATISILNPGDFFGEGGLALVEPIASPVPHSVLSIVIYAAVAS